MVSIKPFNFNYFSVHTYLIRKDESDKCVVVDPGNLTPEETAELYGCLSREGLSPAAILLTHMHPDHIYGVREMQDRYGIPVYMSPADKAMIPICTELAEKFGVPVPDCSFVTTDVNDSDIITAAGLEFKVISTPGHTPGGACFHCEEAGLVFTGDTLFAGSIGRTDFPLGDYDEMIRSIMDKLIWIDGATEIFPGHGRKSTIGWERERNPFLEPFNEKEEEFDPDAAGIEIHG